MSVNVGALTVLVADDSSVFRKLIEQSLSGKNYNLVFATTGREAIEQFTEHAPQIAIVDWTMPDMTGGEISVIYEKPKNRRTRTSSS